MTRIELCFEFNDNLYRYNNTKSEVRKNWPSRMKG